MKYQRHPNDIAHLLSIADPGRVHEFLERDGVFIAKGLIPQERIDVYKAHYEQNSHKWRYSEIEQKNNYLHFPFDIHTRDSVLYLFLNQRAILDVVSKLLGVHRPRIVISIVDWVSIGQTWHMDRPRANMFSNHDTRFAPLQFGAWIALDEIRMESGPFGFIRASNRINYDEDDHYIEKKFAYEKELLDSGQVEISAAGIPVFNIEQIKYLPLSEQINYVYSNFFAEYVLDSIGEGLLIPEEFIAEPGDVLFWSDKTIHCAHESQDGFYRKSVIGHFSE